MNDRQTTDYLVCTNYGFSIPAGAIINGITVNVERQAGNANAVRDAAVYLVINGTIDTSENRATTNYYTTSDVVEAHGGATDTWGGVTSSQINASDFGVAFAAIKPGTAGWNRSVYVDHISITVDYTEAPSCDPPANAPQGVSLTCYCDNFNRTSLNPSTIFGGNWLGSYSDSGPAPYIANPGYLRLTENTEDNAKAVTVPGIFPAAGNYISIEFLMYSYDGGNADGIAVTLSDYTIPPVPGAFGGSLGYAQKGESPISDCTTPGGCPGFAGGWIGVGFDEFGNYQSTDEGREGGRGQRAQSVAVRGSGSGMNGYPWLAGTSAGLSPPLSDGGSHSPSPGHQYQVIVDAREEPTSTSVTVNRALTAGGTYSNLIYIPNVYEAATNEEATQAPVPANWKISFTGSTGSVANIHEIGAVKICAQVASEPVGGTASNFNAIDEAYGDAPTAPYFLNGHIYMKVVGEPFKLNLAALDDNQQIDTDFVDRWWDSRRVNVKLVEQGIATDLNYCQIDSGKDNYCSTACRNKAAVAGGSQSLNFYYADQGQRQTDDFTINTAYKRLIAVITEDDYPYLTACSTDVFSVRPLSFQPVTTTNAGNTATSGTPAFKAGSGQFAMTATTNGIAGYSSGYTGVPKVNNAALQVLAPATVAGVISGSFPAATSGTPSSTSTGTSFTYSEVGGFTLPGYNPVTNAASPRGVYEGVHATECGVTTPCNNTTKNALKADSWTGVDSISSRNDCIDESYSNVKDDNGDYASNTNYGKYGCLFGTVGAASLGRFIPDHFALQSSSLLPACGDATGFTYMNQPFSQLRFTLVAQNATGDITQNYSTGTFATATPLVVAENGGAGLDLSERLLGVPVGTWSAGVYSLDTDAARFARLQSCTGSPAVCVEDTPDGPYDDLLLGIAMSDNDPYGVTTISGANMRADTTGVCTQNTSIATDCNARRINDVSGAPQSTKVRFGRLRLMNAYGSEKLSLPIPMTAQYYAGTTTGFVTNSLDNCTLIAAENVALTEYTGNLAACNVALGGNFNAGVGNLQLGSAGVTGSVRVCVDLGSDALPGPACNAATSASLPWLQGRWSDTNYDDDPFLKALFGVHKKGSEFIYLRELYQ